MRQKRPIIAVFDDEVYTFDSVLEFAKEAGVSTQAATQALDRFGMCDGWKLYDTSETLQKRIDELQLRLQFVKRIEETL